MVFIHRTKICKKQREGPLNKIFIKDNVNQYRQKEVCAILFNVKLINELIYVSDKAFNVFV